MRRSDAIRTALKQYNTLAPLQKPPRPTLDFSEIASYGWLGKFELLKHSPRDSIVDKAWTSPASRSIVPSLILTLTLRHSAPFASWEQRGAPSEHMRLLLRGLLALGSGVLLYVFKQRRWRVDFGLDPGRTMLAVPYRAKVIQLPPMGL